MNLPRDTGISHSEMASKKDCSIYWFILSPEILGLEGNGVNWGLGLTGCCKGVGWSLLPGKPQTAWGAGAQNGLGSEILSKKALDFVVLCLFTTSLQHVVAAGPRNNYLLCVLG